MIRLNFAPRNVDHKKFIVMKPRTIIGLVLVVGGLVKLATIWGLIHWEWFETMSEGPWCMYFSIFVIMWVGAHLIVDKFTSLTFPNIAYRVEF